MPPFAGVKQDRGTPGFLRGPLGFVRGGIGFLDPGGGGGISDLLNWDFSSSIPSELTFSRASGATNEVGGVIVNVGVDEPRFTDDGFLHEGQDTNLIEYSTPSDGGWTNDAGRSVLVANANTAPSGEVEATKIEASASEVNRLTSVHSATLVSGEKYEFTAYVKEGEIIFCQLWVSSGGHIYQNFDLSGVTTGTGAGTGLGAPRIEEAGNGYKRVFMPFTAQASGATIIALALVNSSSATALQAFTRSAGDGAYFWGCEITSYGGSLIKTNGATVIRQADSLTSGFFPSSRGEYTLFYEGIADTDAAGFDDAIIEWNDGTDQNYITLYRRTSQLGAITCLVVRNGTTAAFSSSSSNPAKGTSIKVACSVTDSKVLISVDGVTVADFAPTGAIPSYLSNVQILDSIRNGISQPPSASIGEGRVIDGAYDETQLNTLTS